MHLYDQTLPIGPLPKEAVPTPFALPFGLCNPKGNQHQHPPAAGRHVLRMPLVSGLTGWDVQPLLLLIGFVITWVELGGA